MSERIIDITLPFAEPMRGFRRSVAKVLKADGWNATLLEIYSHAGTHMDAPTHFGVNDLTIDRISPERLMCDCHIIRIPSCQPGETLTVDHMGKAAGKIRAGEAVIFHTGWSKYHDDPVLYREKLPGLSTDLAEWLVEKGVNMIGVEPPSIADVNDLNELKKIHRILMEGDVIILEGLCNLESVSNDKVRLIALPLKIKGGDGAPVRALIIEK